LTQQDAVRLRSGGWRRFAAILGTSRDALSRPLAVGLTTLGLAGLLVASVPSLMPMGSATSAPTTIGAPAVDSGGGGSTTLQASAAAEGAASAAPAAPPDISGSAGDPSAAAPVTGGAGIAAATQEPDVEGFTDGAARRQGGTTDKSQEPGTAGDLLDAQNVGGLSPVVVLSVAFLIAGLGLFAMRWMARRLRQG
jgi:hypothetical protein